MAVPDFQSLMLPLLRLVAEGNEHTQVEAGDAIADELGLSEADRKELLPSGTQERFANRIAWARTHLKHAGLIQSTGRGVFRITGRGEEVLATNPAAVTMKLLEGFPEYLEFRAGKLAAAKNVDKDSEAQSPEERLESSYQVLREALAEEVLKRVKSVPPSFFERLVVDLLVSMGYGGSRHDAGEAVGRSGDDGIDGIIKEDRLGLDVVYLKAKRWSSSVGRELVQALAGSLEGHRARKGVLITTSWFTKDAHEYVTKIEKRIVLIDGKELARLMIDSGLGVGEVATYVLKRINEDYFEGGVRGSAAQSCGAKA